MRRKSGTFGEHGQFWYGLLRPAILALVVLGPIFAQTSTVQWTFSTEGKKAAPGSTILARLEAKIDSGWHLYAPSTPRPPIPLTVKIENPAVESIQVWEPKPDRKLDPNFSVETETYSDRVAFLIEVQIKKDAAPGPLELAANLRYQTCTDTQCLPGRKTVTTNLTLEAGAPANPVQIPSGYSEAKPAAATAPSEGTTTATPTAPIQGASDSMAQFLLIALGLGVASIFTPCVFPMIPITVSFFLNQQTESRRQSVVQALVFCIGIIVLFCVLGLGVTAALGPFGVVQLGSNPWVNGFIALVFGVFGLSLLGAFEITLPSGLLTSLNRASEKGGYFGTLLMGLTFSLTSFACVGPFVGTLLAASVQSGGLQPVLGMLCFATGLAAPFFLLALFPSFLQKLPRSGMWMMRVKVVMGFIILAAMFKYLSNIDQVLQWNWITRERFLAAWVVLFALPGLYLLGMLRLEGIKADEKLGVVRTLVAAAFLIFSISLIPGMFGGRLGELDAYIPASTGGALGSPASGGEPGMVWMKNQYREALAKARQENKLVFVDFTGYACTNCHWMKANMFPRPEIAAAMKDFILVELYTDGTDEASRLNQDLEEKKFKTVAIPFYAILDPDEKVIASFAGSTKKPAEFLAFLKSGLPPAS